MAPINTSFPPTYGDKHVDRVAAERPAVSLEDDAQHPVKKSANLSDEHLDRLRVDDNELVGGLTFSQLSLYEKKSVLVSARNFSTARESS